jgi:hypothetical protein
MGPDWTSPVCGAGPWTQVRLEAEVTVRAPQSELLVLLEDKAAPKVPWHRLTINGQQVETTTSGSAGGFAATGVVDREHWLFLRAPLSTGTSQVKLEIWAEGKSPKASIWVWASRTEAKGPADYPNLLPSPELISVAGRMLLDAADLPAPASRPTTVARPITRIDGIFLDAVEPASAAQGHGKLQRNKSAAEQPLTIAGHSYVRGLGTHAPARIVYNLEGRYRRFQSWAGADGWTTPTVTFEVRVDGQKKWESGLTTRADPPRWVDVDVTNAKTLELIVGDGGNGFVADHADWAEARLLK